MARWTDDDIPNQSGKLVIVTGANSGIGFEAVLALAEKRANVILAVRDAEKGRRAIQRIRRLVHEPSVEGMTLDLADLGSVRRFIEEFNSLYGALHILINNAGVMGIPHRRTEDGFEMQFGTNHLGHFALTGLLLPALLAAPAARVVTVSSINHNFGRMDWGNLNAEKGYHRWGAYAQSKLANLLFVYELQRRFEAAGVTAISVGCHPGFSATNLQSGAARMVGSTAQAAMWGVVNGVFAQSAEMGALPLLYAAISPMVKGGDYIGPRSLFGLRGHPRRVRSHARSYDAHQARQLWQVSEELTGVHYL